MSVSAMPSVDRRTRTDADVQPVDAAAFFTTALPALAAERAELALPGARELSPRPLAVATPAGTWTLALGATGIDITTGEDGAAAVVVLDDEGLMDVVHDVRTPMGFFTGGDLNMPKGRLEDFLDWWVVLRSVLDARPVHTTGAVDFRDADGDPLDLGRAFTPADADADMAHFLAEAGFLHLAGLFTTAEMAAIDAEIDAAAPSYHEDDGRSWWAGTTAGDRRLVRLEYFQEHSPTTVALFADDRFRRLGRLTSDGHRHGEGHLGANIVEALIKPIGVVSGISDVPWHKDCSLGRHSYRCCSLTVGISVTGAGPESGQLRVVAGSHRALVQPAFVRRNLDLPQIDLPTETGDVTIHLSCTLHMSQPPVTRERRVLYTGYRLPETERISRDTDSKIGRIRESAYKVVSQQPAG
jgi:hypothetical protein